MKFALTVGLHPRRPQEMGEHTRLAEANGFAMVMTGDNPSVFGEHFASLALIAINTTTARVGSFISNTLTRHPAISALGLATIDALAPGRAFLGLSSGDTAATNLGLKPATVAQMEAYITAIKDLHAKGEATWEGAKIQAAYKRPGLPVFMAAGGPRTLRLAGRVADGVFVETGLLPEVIEDARRQIAAGAAEAGRSPDDIEVWFHARAAIAESREAALALASASIAGIGKRLARNGGRGKLIPERLWPAIQELGERYDNMNHVGDSRPAANAPLLDQLGLSDYLADRFALVGTPEDYRTRLTQLRALGVQNIAVAATMPDRAAWIEAMGREVIPAMTEA